MLDPHIEEYVYEPLLVVEHGATSVGGIGLTMCLHTTDQEDPTFAAPVQVCVTSTCLCKPALVCNGWCWLDSQ
jgi:hypothetical protein